MSRLKLSTKRRSNVLTKAWRLGRLATGSSGHGAAPLRGVVAPAARALPSVPAEKKPLAKKPAFYVKTKEHGTLGAAIVNFDAELLPRRRPTIAVMEEAIGRHLAVAKEYKTHFGQDALAMILRAKAEVIAALKQQVQEDASPAPGPKGKTDEDCLIYKLGTSKTSPLLYVVLMVKKAVKAAARTPETSGCPSAVDLAFQELYEHGSV